VTQSKANNHAVREAACACVAELMEKVDRHAVAPHVPVLLRALLLCFKDMSWPVRDAACVACGRCVAVVLFVFIWRDGGAGGAAVEALFTLLLETDKQTKASPCTTENHNTIKHRT
jgi:hypothetical protein